MPEWGLTRLTRETKPWGFDPWWLGPGKVITDAVHGDVFITRIEQQLLDSPPMQRLRRVRQLGTPHLVFPGATHTRFSHSLGAVRVVQTLLDGAIGQGDRHHPVPDLFAEWKRKIEQEVSAGTSEGLVFANDASSNHVDDENEARRRYRKKLAEATVLARLGALLHDMGHLPYGHAIEDDLELLTPHDENRSRFTRMFAEALAAVGASVKREAERRGHDAKWEKRMLRSLKSLRPGGRLHQDLSRLVLSKEKDEKGKRIEPADVIRDYPFVADMVGNTICADLLDYLERDHTFTGLPISLGQRYLQSFYITPEDTGSLSKGRMALRVHRKGRVRQDVITEIIKHLRYRYELQERVLVHHTKLTADAMIGKMIELWVGGHVKELIDLSSAARSKRFGAVDEDFEYPGSDSDLNDGKEGRSRRIARWELEELLIERGDDGVLEHVRSADDRGRRSLKASRDLADAILGRRLYRHAANIRDASSAEELHEAFSPAAERGKLEERACRHAGIDEEWKVILWVPGPEMRLKLAELFVDHGAGISKFTGYSKRGSEIYDDHKDLWTISVFVHPGLSEPQTKRVLARLAQLMGTSWDAFPAELGDNPDRAPRHLAAVEARDEAEMRADIDELVEESIREPLPARGQSPGETVEGEPNHAALLREMKARFKRRGTNEKSRAPGGARAAK